MSATLPPAAPAPGTPEAEYPIDEALVRRLLTAQHPDLASRSLELVDAGWDNAMYRLGTDLAIRLPRRAVAAQLILNEQQWLRALADRLPLPIPAPTRIGKPALEFPWSWSVSPWLEGTPADLEPPKPNQAVAFADFLRALHVAAPSDAPRNDYRGVPLATRRSIVEARLDRLARSTDAVTPRVRRSWDEALSAPIDVTPTWLHGDLHPRNILVHRRALSGVIDWGDITAGDCATDLAAVWMLFDDRRARDAALFRYAASESTLRRARGWAVLFGAVLLETGLVDTPRHARIGADTLRRLND